MTFGNLPCYFDDPTIQQLFEDFIQQRREMGYRDSVAMIQIFFLQLKKLTDEEQMVALMDSLLYRRDEFCIQKVKEEETEW